MSSSDAMDDLRTLTSRTILIRARARIQRLCTLWHDLGECKRQIDRSAYGRFKL